MHTRIRTANMTLALACLTGHALAQTQPIRIGVVTPLSGTYAGIGQQVKWGLDLAARQINAAGGVAGRPLELIYEDEEANPSVAVQKAEKLFRSSQGWFVTERVLKQIYKHAQQLNLTNQGKPSKYMNTLQTDVI